MPPPSSLSQIITLLVSLTAIGLGFFALRAWGREHVPAAERWKRLGLDWRAPVLAELAIGFEIGLVGMAGIFALENGTGMLRVHPLVWPIGEILESFVILAVLAGAEELVFRGLLINGIMTLRRSAPLAVAATAVLFGLAHVSNPNATVISVVSTMIGGVMYALAYLWSGRLWMPWGLHLAWNFMQGPVFGFPVSGMTWVSVIRHEAVGPVVLTGGAYGPEGGLVGIAFRLVIILLLVMWHREAMRQTEVAPGALFSRDNFPEQ